ncbi:MAG: hypothetical protein IPI19_16715 [Ignavibacteriales bacterium]|nr:hypothetical protein [Ignavibacteriales bacterium]
MVNTFRKNRKKNFSNLSIVLKYLTIVSFTFCLNELYAQDMISLYKDIVPSAILDNPVFEISINSGFIENAKIHPELIYYNIELLKNLYDKKINAEEIKNYTYKKQKYYLSMRNIFSIDQISKLNGARINPTVSEKCKAYLTELETNSVENQDVIEDIYVVDYNLIDYVVFQYIIKDTSLFYDSSKNYHLLRLNAQHSIMNEYKENYFFSNNNPTIYSDKEIEIMLQNWYLFADPILNVDESMQLYKMIEKIIEYKYSVAHLPTYSISAGYCPYNYSFTLTKEFPVAYRVFPSYSEQPTSYGGPSVEFTSSLPQFVGAVGYRIYIKDFIDYLSYINIQFMVSVSRGQSEDEENILNENTTSTNGFNVFNKERLNWKNTLKAINSYTAKLSTPVLVIGSSLFFELSLNAGLLHYSSSISYDYRLDKREGYSYQYSTVIAAVYGSGTIDVDENHFNFYPTLDISFETQMGIRFTASGNYNYFSLFCGYSF